MSEPKDDRIDYCAVDSLVRIPFPYNPHTMKTPLGIGLSGQDMTPLEVVECCKLADTLGYHSFWLSEGHGGDQFTTLTACAIATDNIKLGTSIISVYVRSAPTIAMAAACLDHFSNGRFILGLGSSHKVQVEGEHGIPYHLPVTRLREYIDVIRTLLRDGAVSYKGSVLDIDRFDFWLPTLRPEVPIYAAAVFEKMLRTCGEITDGTILTWTTLSGAANAAKIVAEGTRAAGRDPSEVEIADLITTVVSTDGPADIEGIRKATGFYAGFFPRYNRALAQNGFPDEAAAIRAAYLEGKRGPDLESLVSDSMLRSLAIVGAPDECRERIQSYRDAGVTLPIIAPRTSGPNAAEKAKQIIRALAP